MITDVVIAIAVIAVFLLILTVLLIATIRRVDILAKKDFTDKLQEYDFLIDDKESQVADLDQKIKQQTKQVEALNSKAQELLSLQQDDLSSKEETILPKNIVFSDDKALLQYKDIKNSFAVNAEPIIRKIIKENPIDQSERGIFIHCQNIKKALNSERIYQIMTTPRKDQFNLIKQYLRPDDFAFAQDNLGWQAKNFNIRLALRDLDARIQKTNPKYLIYVPTSDLNFNHISDDIETRVDKNLTEGFKIVHGDKVFDYSI